MHMPIPSQMSLHQQLLMPSCSCKWAEKKKLPDVYFSLLLVSPRCAQRYQLHRLLHINNFVTKHNDIVSKIFCSNSSGVLHDLNATCFPRLPLCKRISTYSPFVDNRRSPHASSRETYHTLSPAQAHTPAPPDTSNPLPTSQSHN